jgi:hypothetical protein
VDRRDDGEAERRLELELELAGRTKLGRLMSFSGLLWCCWSTGSGMGGSGGSCRWRAGAAAEIRRGGELGKERGEQNGCVQVQEQVHEELQDVLGVQKKARSRGSSCWRPAGCVAARAAAARRGGARIE